MSTPSSRPLKDILVVDQLEPLLFRSQLGTGMPTRAFGGEIAGQAVLAAGLTVPSDRPIHSAHSHFLRGGRAGEAVTYRVLNSRDGGSYSTRQVEALQHGEVILLLTASFHREEDSQLQHQLPRAHAPGVDATPAPSESFLHDAEMLSGQVPGSGVALRVP